MNDQSTARRDSLTDPWAVVSATHTVDWQRWMRPVAVAWFSASGVALAVWSHGHDQRRAAAMVFVLGALVGLVSALPKRWRALAVIPFAVIAAGAFAILGPTLGWWSVVAFAVMAVVSVTWLSSAGSLPHEALGRVGVRSSGFALSPLSFGLLAALANAAWAMVASPVVLVVVGVVFGWSLVASQLSDVAAAAEPGLRRLLRATVHAVGVLVTLVAALPLLYVPYGLWRGLTAVARFVSGRSRRVVGSTFVPRQFSVLDEARDANAMFVSPSRRAAARSRWVALALLAAIVGWGAWRLSHRTITAPPVGSASSGPQSSAPGTSGPSTSPSVPVTGPAVPNFPFSERAGWPYQERRAYLDDPVGARIMADEGKIRIVDDPVTVTRALDVTSDAVNVSGGERRTLRAGCSCEIRASAWFFGGSTAFGIGQRDDHTIASDLVRDAEADNVALVVRNFGAPGWALWQEHEAFAQRIASDEPLPDVAIFYGGYNDVTASMAESQTRAIDANGRALLDPAMLWDLHDAWAADGLDAAAPQSFEQRVDAAADRYRAAQRSIEELAERNGIRTLFVFQPDAFADDVQMQAVEDFYGVDAGVFDLIRLNDALDQVYARVGQHVNLRDVLDGRDDVVFLDSIHTNEAAATVVADRIWESARPVVVEAAG